MMKNILLLLTLLCFTAGTSMIWADEKGEKKKDGFIKTGVKGVVSETISTGKDVISGVSEGIDEGRKEGQSADTARIVSKKDDMEKYLKAEVLKVEQEGPGRFKVILALRNSNEYPVRVTNLNEVRNVVLLDGDGFAYTLDSPAVQGRSITVLGKAATKAIYVFNNVEGVPAVFRLYDMDYTLPKVSQASSAQTGANEQEPRKE